MDKLFISAEDLLLDSFRLAQAIYKSGFRPDFIVGVWRGGTPVGIAVQEYLAFRHLKTDHIAIRTSAYSHNTAKIDEQTKEVRVHGLDYVVQRIRNEHNLLIVDDVFDSGRSVEAILAQLTQRTGEHLPSTIKIACPWYKPTRNQTSLTPDYFLHTTDQWLVFPHELMGLSEQEITAGKPKVAEILFADEQQNDD